MNRVVIRCTIQRLSSIDSCVRRRLDWRKFRTTISALSSSSKASSTCDRSYRLLIIGGGTAGCAMASKFSTILGKNAVAVVDPSNVHYNQAMFTMVGAGMKRLQDTYHRMEFVLPKHCDWIKDSAEVFNPEKQTVVTGNGTVVKYEFLIVSMGLQLNYDKIEGCIDALATDPSVCSIYSPLYVGQVRSAIDKLTSGLAIFTFPNTPIKCAGAAQKICYLTEDILSQSGRRGNVKLIYNTAPGVIFSNPYYAAALEKLASERSIHWNAHRNLVKINSQIKEAVFEVLEDGKNTGKFESMKHRKLLLQARICKW